MNRNQQQVHEYVISLRPCRSLLQVLLKIHPRRKTAKVVIKSLKVVIKLLKVLSKLLNLKVTSKVYLCILSLQNRRLKPLRKHCQFIYSEKCERDGLLTA